MPPRRRLLEETTSRLAVWARRIAVFALVAALLSIVIERAGIFEIMPVLATFGAALVLGVLAALRSAGLVSASEGERAAQIAILLAHLAAAGLCWFLARAIFGRPAVSNTSEMGKNQ